LRRLRLAAPVQLPLDLPGIAPITAERWLLLSEPARQAVLVLLARMIARGVIDEEANDEH
jgi:hypothetical protein